MYLKLNLDNETIKKFNLFTLKFKKNAAEAKKLFNIVLFFNNHFFFLMKSLKTTQKMYNKYNHLPGSSKKKLKYNFARFKPSFAFFFIFFY